MMTAPSEEPEMSDTYRIVRSTVTDDGTVRIAIDTEPMPEPGPDEVVVAVEAAPINPSDLGMLIAGADPESFASVDGALVGTLSPAAMAMNAARVGQPMPCGNEGAGTVVAAGSSPGPGAARFDRLRCQRFDVRNPHQAFACDVLARSGWCRGGRRGVVVCEPADCVGHDGNDATRRAHSACPYRSSVEPWSDVEPAVSGRWHCVGQCRASRRTSRPAPGRRGRPCRRVIG